MKVAMDPSSAHVAGLREDDHEYATGADDIATPM